MNLKRPSLKLTNSTSLSSSSVDEQQNCNCGILSTLKKIGYQNGTKLADTLQGQIWRAQKVTEFGEVKTSVIKVTNQSLHQLSSAIVCNKYYTVQENILLEQSLLKYLTQDPNCPKSIVRFESFFKTNTDFFLVMEDGGQCLFDFVEKAFSLLHSGLIDLSHWKIVCKTIFKQMVESVEYIHSKNIAHFDISCENFLINDVKIKVCQTDNGKVQKIEFDIEDIQIKLCDFGLAQKFTNSVSKSSKFVGKPQYSSVEVLHKVRGYNPMANDIWCLGLCFFMISTGCAPWNRAHTSDESFVYAMKYGMDNLLRALNLKEFVSDYLCHVFQSIFVYEQSRIKLANIKKYLHV